MPSDIENAIIDRNVSRTRSERIDNQIWNGDSSQCG